MFPGQTIRNLKRTRDIIGILLKYGLEEVVAGTALINMVPERQKLKWQRDDKSIFEFSRSERIRLACEELGPTFIKGAQILSNRPDLVPNNLIEELKKLQSNVPPFPFSEVKRIIEQETGKPIAYTFSIFHEIPVGSASIGQVHKAILRNGEEVVVKVRRPGVSGQIKKDLSILKEIAKRGGSFFESQGILNILDIVHTFEKSISKELNYLEEAKNIHQFRNFYAGFPEFYTPQVFREHTTERMLTMEFINACEITDLNQLRAWDLDPEEIATTGMKLYLMQIFEFGFFHADPHPGNVLVREDGVICLIDFGMMGKMTKRDKYAFAGLFVSMAKEDARSMAINFRKLAIDDNINDFRTFESSLEEMIAEYAHLDVEESNMADFANSLQKIMYRYRIQIPGSVFLVLRALTILEGIGKTIMPHFNTQEFLIPYGEKLFKEQYSIENMTEELLYRGGRMVSFFNRLPWELSSILRQTRKGQFKIEIHHKNYEHLLNKMDAITNRLVLTILIAVLILSSAIISLVQVPDAARADNGLPLISITGFTIAIGLSFLLILSIWRSKRY